MLNRLERLNDPVEAVIAALAGLQSHLWTACPGLVNSFNAVAMTCTIQPTIQAQQTMPDNSKQWVNLPLLLDVPVMFMNGGGYFLTFPIQVGDEALVVFSSRCIDGWWSQGGITPPAEMRMHDLSDGFALVGPRSQPRVIAGVSTTHVQLRTTDGLTFIEIAPDGKVRLQADTVEVHARTKYKWDVNGYGEDVVYAGANVWNVDTYKTAGGGQTVNTTAHNVNPPETP